VYSISAALALETAYVHVLPKIRFLSAATKVYAHVCLYIYYVCIQTYIHIQTNPAVIDCCCHINYLFNYRPLRGVHTSTASSPPAVAR